MKKSLGSISTLTIVGLLGLVPCQGEQREPNLQTESSFTAVELKGAFLDGGKNYRLHLPPNVAVKLFWSVVVYDALSRSELQNGEEFPSVSQYTGPVANADGSVDVYFGPQAAIGKEKNWIKTIAGKGWFLYLRFYSPTEAFFNQTWKPDDIVEMNS